MTNPTIDPISYKAGIEAAGRAAFRKAQSVYRSDYDTFPQTHTWETTTEDVRECWRKIAAAAVASLRTEPQTAPASIVTCCVTGAIPGDGGACGDCDPCIKGEASVPEAVKRLIAEKNSLIARIVELEGTLADAAPADAERLALAGGDHLKRCTICGFVIDVSYKAEKPTADFTTRGRAKTKSAEEDEEETYQIGVRDGYESAIQDLDIATGGDGEFKGSTLPGGTVDVPAMKARIIERFQDLRAGGWRGATCKELLQVPDAERLALAGGDIVDRLKRAIATATNDDETKPLTDKRARQVERIDTMLAAIDEIERLHAGGWRDDIENAPRCVEHEERGIYKSDDGSLFYFKPTHWRPSAPHTDKGGVE